MAAPRFVGAALVASATYVQSPALSQGELPLKADRGDDDRAKHWYEFRTTGGRRAITYVDREARVGRSRWWLYSIPVARRDNLAVSRRHGHAGAGL